MRLLPQLLLAAAVMLPLSARSELLTYHYSGKVDRAIQTFQYETVPWDGTLAVAVGDTFYGSVSYETNTPGNFNGFNATYSGAVISMTFNLPAAGIAYTQASSGFASVRSGDGNSDFSLDGQNGDYWLGTYTGFGVGLHKSGPWATGFDLAPAQMAGATGSMGFEIQKGLGLTFYALSGSLDTFTRASPPVASAVPEIDGYALMLSGLGLLGVLARRRRSNA